MSDQSVQFDLSFEVVPDDLLAFTRNWAKTSPFSLRQAQMTRVLVTAIVLVVGLLAAFTLTPVGDCGGAAIFSGMVVFALFALLAVGVWFWWPRRWAQAVERNGRRQLELENAAYVFGPKQYVGDASGLRFSSLVGGGYVLWPGVMSVDVGPEAAYLYVGVAQAHIIPRRAFASAEEFDRFVEWTRYWLAQSRTAV